MSDRAHIAVTMTGFDEGMSFVRELSALENSALDVAWDAIRQVGWPPERLQMHRHVDEHRTELVITAGRELLRDLAVFEVRTVFEGLTVTVEYRWLTSIPRYDV